MKIVMPWQKTCPKCGEYLSPSIYANPDLDPRVLGNPWRCDICSEVFGCKDGTSYIEHLNIIKNKYIDEDKKGIKMSEEKNGT